jgi:hypothetical protein
MRAKRVDHRRIQKEKKKKRKAMKIAISDCCRNLLLLTNVREEDIESINIYSSPVLPNCVNYCGIHSEILDEVEDI